MTVFGFFLSVDVEGKKDLYTCRLDLNFVSNQSRLTHEVYKNGLN